MTSSPLLGSERIRRRLAELASRPLNFDPASLQHASPASGWTINDLCEPLPSEPPGSPVEGGSWAIARRLMRGYEFADPSIVRAYYDPEVPLEGRNMLLELRALGIAHKFVGVRVGEVYEKVTDTAGGRVCIWGWNYGTLDGHVEMGQMDWEVWKWLDDGRVEFRVHAVSRVAHISNPFVWLGFRLLRKRERNAFLASTKRRMRTFTELALAEHDSEGPIRSAAQRLTARPSRGADVAHDQLARSMRKS